MASSNRPWLDDLSDDWVPEPADSSPAPCSAPQSKLPKPRSRIPRLRSSPAPAVPPSDGIALPKTKPSPARRRSALTERSLSESNIQISPDFELEPKPTGSRQASLSFSAASVDSVMIQKGTIAVQRSPSKQTRIQDTPEWRRRLLKGQMAYGDQKDLFSPMGLEKLFNRPAPPSKQSVGHVSGQSLMRSLGEMPSSPPPWKPLPNSEKIDESQVDLSKTSVKEESIVEESGLQSDSEKAALEQTQEGLSEINQSADVTTERHNLQSNMTSRQSSLAVPGRDPRSRTTSGQLEMRNESFSPVFITKNGTVDDQIDYIPLDASRSHIGTRSQNPDFGNDGNDRGERSETDINKSAIGDGSSLAKIGDETLPDDLPVGTPDVGDLSKFITTRRGGYSADGSFQRKPLSPTPASTIASRLQESRATSSGTTAPRSNLREQIYPDSVPPEAPTPPVIIVTPHKRSTGESAHRPLSSGSPLKLFGDHDTFTSNKLHRRLTQLEDMTDGHTAETRSNRRPVSPAKSTSRARVVSIKEVKSEKVVTQETWESRRIRATREFSQGSNFGQGELDSYEFHEEFSIESADDDDILEEPEMSGEELSPASDVIPPGSQSQFKFQLDESPSVGKAKSAKRKASRGSSKASRAVSRRWDLNLLRSPKPRARQTDEPSEDQGTTTERTEGKRLSHSPNKNPTPKRRRTLQSTDLEEPNDIINEPVAGINGGPPPMIGQKRKDVRPSARNNMADPEILAKRHILRPRNPTPSQRRREQIQAEVMEATEAFVQSSPRLHVIQEHLESSNLESPGPVEARAVASEVAAFSMRMAKSAAKGEVRKRSVTTQDFLNEAMKIMEFIRTKGRPASGLNSVEESESESPLPNGSHLDIPDISPTYSRPVSREGPGSGWRNPNAPTVNSQVLSHLKKFQEKSDDFFGSSVRSLHVSQAQQSSPTAREFYTNGYNNIRIHDNYRVRSGHQEDDDVFQADSPSMGLNGTQKSNPSTHSSFGKTAMSNGSRKSENVATLAPEAVAHLIPEVIAGMSFDREKGIWVKKRTVSRRTEEHVDVSSTNGSEEDPFQNIPDLSVDETKELNYRASETNGLGREGVLSIARGNWTMDLSETVPEESRPPTRDAPPSVAPQMSSVPSKPSYLMTSSQLPETRATSWSEMGNDGPTIKQNMANKYMRAVDSQHFPSPEEVEHEIGIDEGRNGSPISRKSRRVRGISFTFSSPEESHAARKHVENVGAELPSEVHDDVEESYLEHLQSHKKSSSPVRRSSVQYASKRFQRNKFNMDSVPPIDELNELSIIADDRSGRRMRLSVSLGNPAQALIPAPSSPTRAGDVTFYLSELPDFSINQIDEREDPERIVLRRDGSTAFEDRYKLGTAELVKALQDEEPEEPFWEDLRKVNLVGKGLPNLNRLDAFCWRLEEVDVSNNTLYQIVGLPPTVRRLNVGGNCLSSLTTWEHLPNLQYLDIANNDMDSLKGLANLIHLRELNVSGNRIESLDGILELDGLIKVDLRKNKMRQLNLESANLKSLIELNASGNEITTIHSLHLVPQLQELWLDENMIASWSDNGETAQQNFCLRRLSICKNELVYLRISRFFPNLECLRADQNRLSKIDDLEKLRRLRTLSVREQQLTYSQLCEPCPTSFTSHPDLGNLSLSANRMQSLRLPCEFLNLQRLELANCGLLDLPDNFGLMIPNVRKLNLNFNAIKDLCPLLNTKRLEELHVAGNRLSRLRRNLAVLSKLKTLVKVDLRDNPLTLGFYPAATEQRLVSIHGAHVDITDEAEPHTLPDQDQEVERVYSDRLDEDTRLRRRVYEMMLATSCSQLEHLDGLKFASNNVLVKDEVWERLVLLGVLKKSAQQEGSGKSGEGV